jgi:glucose/arabinose dehydrogenase
MLARVPVLRPLETLAILLAALALAACGSDGDEQPQSAQTETDVVAEERSSEEQTARGAQAGGRVRLARVGSFTSPLYVTSPPEDPTRLFVVEQSGRIRVVRDGRKLDQPFLDVSRLIVSGGEQGLLGLAFAPDYAQSKKFYVNLTNRAGDTRIVEYTAASEDRADPDSARVLIEQDQPEPNHNGGQMAFGPDGLLYIGLGDGGGGNDSHGRRGNAQNRAVLLGKILRIDPKASGSRPYSIPDSNPFARTRGLRGEIFAYGLRNPWRFSFDRSTGNMTIADVGQDAVEEVSYVSRRRARGGNFGWRPWEGTKRIFPREQAPGHIPPVLQLRHSQGYCSVTGGYVVRSPELPALRGQYVFGDFCQGRVRAARLRASGATNHRALRLPKVDSLSSFGEDARGRIYVTSLNGDVFRLTQR